MLLNRNKKNYKLFHRQPLYYSTVEVKNEKLPTIFCTWFMIGNKNLSTKILDSGNSGKRDGKV